MYSFYTYNNGTGEGTEICDEECLIMKTDGTAEYYEDDGKEYEFKYTWDTTEKEIYMKVEKSSYADGAMLNYNQLLSKLTIDECKKEMHDSYIRNKEDKYFEEEYPNCKNYDDYEKFKLTKWGYENFDEYFKDWKKEALKYLNTIFGAKVTYSYDFDKDDKMVLTEKFTGMKNLLFYSSFKYDVGGTRVYIEPDKEDVEIYLNDVRWYGEFSTGDNIVFEKEGSEETKTGSYTEDIAKETVTVNFDGESYVCKFEGRNFIEVDE